MELLSFNPYAFCMPFEHVLTSQAATVVCLFGTPEIEYFLFVLYLCVACWHKFYPLSTPEAKVTGINVWRMRWP
jgi:hypothetical protein